MAKDSSFCHVFLSFKGETRNKFTCFLHDALKAQGFEVFMDNETIPLGDEVDSRIRKGIRDSMSAIVVFSENYAYSTWCLNELLLILERKKTSRYFIIPIFYEVEPEDIRHQRGSFGVALEKHKVRHPDMVEKWRQALAEVSNIRGEHVQGMQNVFIKSIVKTFREKMAAEFPYVRLPLLITPPQQGNNLVSTSSNMNPNNKVIVYTSGKEEPIGSGEIVMMVLARHDVRSSGSSSESIGSVGTSMSSHFGETNYPSFLSSNPAYGSSASTFGEDPPPYTSPGGRLESFENPLAGTGSSSFESSHDEGISSLRPHYGAALFDFTSAGGDEMNLVAGEEVEIEYEVDGWFYVKKKRPGSDGKLAGLVPVLYVSQSLYK